MSRTDTTVPQCSDTNERYHFQNEPVAGVTAPGRLMGETKTARAVDGVLRDIERLRAELTFWRDGLSAKEVADNMKLWDGKSE